MRAEMGSAEDLIRALKLLPHPEGGWYRETYRAAESVPLAGLPQWFAGPRSQATAIYFLLTSDRFSALHRIRSDEQWYFHAGSGLTIHVLHPDGRYQSIKLGPGLEEGETFQAVVPHDCWFGATVDLPDTFSLVGCSVAPGFDFADFELAERQALARQFPQHSALIRRLTRI